MSHRRDSRSQRPYDRSDDPPSSHRRQYNDDEYNDHPSDSRRGRDYPRGDSHGDVGRDRYDDGYNSRSKPSNYDPPSSHQRRDARDSGNYDNNSRGERYDDRSNRDRRSYVDGAGDIQASRDNRHDPDRHRSDVRGSHDDGRFSHPSSRPTYNNDTRGYQGSQGSFQRGRDGNRDHENRFGDDRGYSRGDRPSYRGSGGRGRGGDRSGDRGGGRGGDQPRQYNSDRNAGRNDNGFGRNRGGDNMQNNASFDDLMDTDSADPSNLVLDGPFMFGYATLTEQKWDVPEDTPDEVVGKPAAIIPISQLPPKPLKMRHGGLRPGQNGRDTDANRQGNERHGEQTLSEALGNRLEDSVKVQDEASTSKDADNDKILEDVPASDGGTDQNAVGKKRKVRDEGEDVGSTAVKGRKLEDGEREETGNGNGDKKACDDRKADQTNREVSG